MVVIISILIFVMSITVSSILSNRYLTNKQRTIAMIVSYIALFISINILNVPLPYGAYIFALFMGSSGGAVGVADSIGNSIKRLFKGSK